MTELTDIESRSPQAPDDLIVKVPATLPDIVDRHAAAARRAQREWSALPPGSRASALDSAASALAAAADELADLVIREVGKPYAEATAEVARMIAIFRYYAQQVFAAEGSAVPVAGPPGSLLLEQRRPRGIAGLITPWNFPLAIPAWKAAPALAAGNAVLLKPALAATGCALRLAEIIGAHLPTGLVSILPGDAATGAAVIASSDVVSFTGSTGIGRTIVASAAELGLPVQAEMGGLNASVILPDADMPAAARIVARSAMGYAGQKCTATSRVVVIGDRTDFDEALVAELTGLRFGDPADAAVEVGPVISSAARAAVLDAAARAAHDGGRILRGSEAQDPGWFVTPALVDSLPPDAWLNQHEIFGPIACLLHVPDAATAVSVVNDTGYGLVTGLFTADLESALALGPRFETGMVKVNTSTTGADFQAPFGGAKWSSYGPPEQGPDAIGFYSRHQTTTVLTSPR